MDYKRNLLQTFKKINVNGLSHQEQGIIEEIGQVIKSFPHVKYKLDSYGNMIITAKGKGKKSLLYTTHLDVIANIGTVCINKKTMKLQIKEQGMILGADSRAGASVILQVLKDLDRKLYKKLVIVFTICEEHGFQGILHCDLNKFKFVECIISADRPICTWQKDKGNIINCHLLKTKHNVNLSKLKESSELIKRKVVCHNANHRSAYTGGDASFIKGFDVFDFTCGTKYQHTSKEELSLKLFFISYKLMLSFSKTLLK